jgi:hypothetical protein
MHINLSILNKKLTHFLFDVNLPLLVFTHFSDAY